MITAHTHASHAVPRPIATVTAVAIALVTAATSTSITIADPAEPSDFAHLTHGHNPRLDDARAILQSTRSAPNSRGQSKTRSQAGSQPDPQAGTAPAVRFVDATAPDGGDGLSWQTAFNDLQLPLALAELDAGVHEIRVAEGTYTPDSGTGDRTAEFRLIAAENLQLLGGYPQGGEGPRDPARHPTVLSGDLAGDDLVASNPGSGLVFLNIEENAYRVLGLSGAQSSVVVDGFTIRGGHNLQRGGGFAAAASSATLRNTTIAENSASFEGGGAFIATGSDLTLDACAFVRNRAGTDGGGAFLSDSRFNAPAAVFRENQAETGGGAHLRDLPASQPPLEGLAFESNTATGNGGGIFETGAGPGLTLNACRFDANAASTGGGLHTEKPFHASACDWTANNAEVRAGGLLAAAGGALDNCMFADNTTDDDAAGASIIGEWTVRACTFERNIAADTAGGLFVGGFEGVIEQTRFVGNHASTSGGLNLLQDTGGNSAARYLVRDVEFTDNTAEDYAAGLINAASRRFRLERIRVIGNAATEDGGGLAFGRACDVIDAEFVGNSAGGSGGAAVVFNASPSHSAYFQDCRFENNTADAGGAVSSGSLTRAIDCTFTENTAANGGAWSCGSNPNRLVGTRLAFERNTATGEGGAIYRGRLELDTCLFAGNAAGNRGGAAARVWGEIDASTITQNDAPNTGGVQAEFETEIRNSILWGNTALGSPERAQLVGPELTASHCIIEGFLFTIGEQNTGADPIFADPLGPDGTEATGDEDFRLGQNSPGLDSSARADADMRIDGPRDILGRPRFAALGGVSPMWMDRGAFESQDCDADARIDHEAAAAGDTADCNRNGVPDTCEVAWVGAPEIVVTSEPAPAASTGSPVAIAGEGNTMLFGMNGEQTPSGQGVVYAYERTGNAWRQTQRIESTGNDFRFGTRIEQAGDLAVVYNDNNPRDRVTLLRRSSGTWETEHVFTPHPQAEDAGFGVSAGISGSLVVIGAHAYQGVGALFVYKQIEGEWQRIAEIIAPLPFGSFARNLAANAQHLVASDMSHRLHFYRRNGDLFEFVDTIGNFEAGARSLAGDLELSGDTLVVADGDYNANGRRGTLATLGFRDGQWIGIADDLPIGPTADEPETLIFYASAAHLRGDRLAVSARVDGAPNLEGVTLLYRLENDTWHYDGRIAADRDIADEYRPQAGAFVGPDYLVVPATVYGALRNTEPGFVTAFQSVTDTNADGVPDDCTPTCGPADLADPLGALDLADIATFAAAFQNADPIADLDDSGTLDLDDITAFVAAFLAGCP